MNEKMCATGKKGLDSEFHTLFIEEVAEKRLRVKEARQQYFIVPSHKLYRVFISAFSENKKGLHAVFNELRKADEDDTLELRINSDGGLVTEGQQFFNVILEKFGNNTTTVLDNHGYSMGALLFCMGYRRVVYPYSELMFHNYTHGSWGKGENVKSHVKHTAKNLTSFFKDMTVSQGFLKKKEFKEMLLGKDFWMDCEEMCRRGIATHVVVFGETITAKHYLKGVKQHKKANKKNGKSK
ncbi:MAG: ATP-dependent Clp protease proteolytic subunit [Cocleimonas sp.]|nr:ATP-dependent Clp protease proteolytic subunit [Cocleimonas sp.]